MGINVLDCTIRDGGHLCNWNFDHSTVKEAYNSAIRSGIEYFEIGYRNLNNMNNGDFYYSDDKLLFKLLKPSEKCKITLMADAGKSNSDYFKECKDDLTIVKAVRVASYPYEYEKAIELIEDLHNKGYEVFLNLMAASEITKDQYDLLKNWSGKKYLKAVSFADSFGSFLPKDIEEYYKKLQNVGFEKIGFHAHNNLQLAFANSLKAIELGCVIIDASIYGMGRGAGNLPIEVLISYLSKEKKEKYNVVPYLDIIDRYFYKLINEYRWGYSLNSLMSGIKNIHPYYINEIMNKKVYTIDEAWNAIDTIKEQCPLSFSKEKLNDMLGKRFFKPLTSEKVSAIYETIKDQFKIIEAKDSFCLENIKLENKHKGKNFVIIANGPSIKDYQLQIKKFIKEKDALTIGVNYLADLFDVDYHVFVSRKRFLKYYKYINKNSILLIPTFWGKEFINNIYSNNYEFFNLRCTENYDDECIDGNTQVCVNLNVAISSILLAYQMGADKIYVVGMDGYNDEMNKKITYFYDEEDNVEDAKIATVKYEKLHKELDRVDKYLSFNDVEFSLITPTSYLKYYANILG
ncbi:hypothetical protein DVV91_03730 [Clostridium botulinum]|uniref:aldolase catalytic domain-containing protein n=1 Tax=Clostridium botulinum TaxID=1491 RepID=UPI001401129E|nr:aldolase catalytic domain-containing protein [Clostridium botulinum]MBN1073454.1 hypothetical protein [Clostridium botulinum]NFN14994.1 hypothetical protein [Clostridium botulinum]